MSIKSSSRISTTRTSDVSHSSMQKVGKTGATVRRGGGSSVSLLWPSRYSAIFRTGKTGFKVPRYQNNYRLSSFNPFNCEVVENILEDILKGTLTGMKYNALVCLKLCQDMSSEVRSRIYRKDYDRYKYVVTFSIFEKTGQAINVSTSRLGDVERDTFCTRSFENSELISIGTVYAVYYE